MAVKLRLRKMGRTHRAFFRLDAMDSRRPRDGRIIEALGWYDPCAADEDKQTKIDVERVQYWLSVGAQPTDTVRNLLKKQGVAFDTKGKAIPATAE
ncbi:MAG: 30S ribosomal protein S16 [Phycisphaerales bacterium]|nr:30S ribosomal protein S16 [Phycisphaerales bacterium]MBT7170358.1 30S ribosomal protein S16 [Phycisphaerales bacterium]